MLTTELDSFMYFEGDLKIGHNLIEVAPDRDFEPRRFVILEGYGDFTEFELYIGRKTQLYGSPLPTNLFSPTALASDLGFPVAKKGELVSLAVIAKRETRFRARLSGVRPRVRP